MISRTSKNGGPRRKLCTEGDCANQPSHGIAGTSIPIYCTKHAAGKDMVNVKRKRCKEEGCLTAPGYGMEKCAAEYCARHSKPGMVDVKNKKCLGEGCRKAPSYGVAGTRKTLYCSQHAPEGMVNIVNVKRCKEDGCDKHPTYGVEGTSATHCLKHAKEGMVNMKDRRCEDPLCKRQPSFGFAGAKFASFCLKHAKEGMINVIRRPCSAGPHCFRVPFYNFEGNKVAIFCSDHAKPGMVDVKSKQCAYKDCRKHPLFGRVEGTRKNAIFCAAHAEPDMLRVIRTLTCAHPGCNKVPHFGKEGTTSAVLCAQHHEPGMINVRARQCKRSGCGKIPVLGHPGRDGDPGRATVCEDHGEEGMVNLEINKKRVADGKVQVGAQPGQKRARRNKPQPSSGVVGVSGNRHALYLVREDEGEHGVRRGGSARINAIARRQSAAAASVGGDAGHELGLRSHDSDDDDDDNEESCVRGMTAGAVADDVRGKSHGKKRGGGDGNNTARYTSKTKKPRSNSKKARLLRASGTSRSTASDNGSPISLSRPTAPRPNSANLGDENRNDDKPGHAARRRIASTAEVDPADDPAVSNDNPASSRDDQGSSPSSHLPLGMPTSPVGGISNGCDNGSVANGIDDGTDLDRGDGIELGKGVGEEGGGGVGANEDSDSDACRPRSSQRLRTSCRTQRVAIGPRAPAPAGKDDGSDDDGDYDSGLPSSRTRSSRISVKLEHKKK